MKFKVGDLVKIKDGLKEGEQYGGLTLNSGIMNFAGAKRIERISGSRSQFYEIGGFYYTKEMLEKVEEMENGMRFKVGDKVRVREWEDMERQFGVDSDGDIVCEKIFISTMRGHCGKTFEIIKCNERLLQVKRRRRQLELFGWHACSCGVHKERHERGNACRDARRRKDALD